MKNETELCKAIVVSMDTKTKARQLFLKREHDPAWRMACLVDLGWLQHENPFTVKGLDAIIKLAEDLGLDVPHKITEPLA